MIFEKMKEMKSEFDLQGIDDNKILNALIKTNGNIEAALINLFNPTIQILDPHQKQFI